MYVETWPGTSTLTPPSDRTLNRKQRSTSRREINFLQMVMIEFRISLLE
jgi:hypothetical protein